MKFNDIEVKKYNEESAKNSTPFSRLTSDRVHQFPQYTHEYEVFPYTYNSVITMKGKVIDKQSYQTEGRKHKVIYNGNTTIVILHDGSKGIAKRNPKDMYDKYTGYVIAYKRARIAKLQKELEELTK